MGQHRQTTDDDATEKPAQRVNFWSAATATANAGWGATIRLILIILVVGGLILLVAWIGSFVTSATAMVFGVRASIRALLSR
jgi:uncharacterized ion transporter superfamily protein YfcC